MQHDKEATYVEQARVPRRLWGEIGGLDGEARSALGEQELAVFPPGSARRARTEQKKNVGGRGGTNQIHVASFFHRDLALHRNYRALDQVCRVRGLFGLGTVRTAARGRRQASSGDAAGFRPSTRTLGSRAFPNAEPFFAFCVRGGDKAHACRACATATLNA